jgi:SAM-dependent methyltransferase
MRWAYRALLSRRGDALSAYQRQAVEEFLAETPAQLLAVGVLEVGSDVDNLVVREFISRGVPRVVGINPALTPGQLESMVRPPGLDLLPLDIRATGFPDRTFGAIFSVAVLEHLNDLDLCLAEMHRLLVPGGRVYAAFGPIWSSSLGHHVFADEEGVQLRHWDPRLNPVDDFGHLLQPRETMRERIAAARGGLAADAAVAWIYDRGDINRLFYEDYVSTFERSPFRINRLVPEREAVSARRLAELRAAHPGRTVFDVRNAVVVLEKT